MEPSTDLERARLAMVDDLRRRGIQQPAVLAALARVPRERFVAGAPAAAAYDDRAMPIDCGQTISQPYMVAIMTEALELTGRERMLEIGTGSGYQTAILAELAARVVSLERHAELSRSAAGVLAELGYTNVRLEVADGTAGWPEEAPYDRILITAAASECPPALFDQLAEGGILVAPLGSSEGQVLTRIRRLGGRAEVDELVYCRFVPLVGRHEPPME